MTICLECAAAVGLDPMTGDEIAISPSANLVCGHSDARINPVTGARRKDMPPCRDINRGDCQFFIANRELFIREASEVKEIVQESIPLHLRDTSATQR